ncbi:unnamed protein product [Acanthosepion pharaonis]|uniref:Peptidase A2 domain-containing protein n=1 Tax=Acanthosepion pharaonis TaxID=158019 RepID=A0A812E8B5_ACAPH|nr:unnamed protein product [Sepia pharaonis]
MSENTPIDQLADAADRIFSQLDNQTTPVHSAEATRDHRSWKNSGGFAAPSERFNIGSKSHGRSRFPSAGAEVDLARPVGTRMPLLLCVTTTDDLGLQHTTAPSRVPILRSRENKTASDRLFYVTDTRNNLRFLVDTGAAISVLPVRDKARQQPFQLRLQAANGSTVTTPPVSSSFIQDLRLKMANLCYTPPRHCPSDIYLQHQLKDCEFVFVRNDSVKRPLTPAYTGPYRVLKRADKYFQIQKGVHTDNVSIDRLKPAFIEKPSSHTTSQSTPQVQDNFKTPVSLDKPKLYQLRSKTEKIVITPPSTNLPPLSLSLQFSLHRSRSLSLFLVPSLPLSLSSSRSIAPSLSPVLAPSLSLSLFLAPSLPLSLSSSSSTTPSLSPVFVPSLPLSLFLNPSLPPFLLRRSLSPALTPSLHLSLSSSRSIAPSLSVQFSLPLSLSLSFLLHHSLSLSLSLSLQFSLQAPLSLFSCSIAPSLSSSRSIAPSLSPSLSFLLHRSLPSLSLSLSLSQFSFHRSLSLSLQFSVHRSLSLSRSIAPSSLSFLLHRSLSPSLSSRSISPSLSPSLSFLLHRSLSPSLSSSRSIAPSLSLSAVLGPSLPLSISSSRSIAPSFSLQFLLHR